ncbi:hypothetical protein BKI52_00485 [marine bacterium AO1-C]|nr:hypothetical protein BKI52_00485 [marine bacterium AO1-C]
MSEEEYNEQLDLNQLTHGIIDNDPDAAENRWTNLLDDTQGKEYMLGQTTKEGEEQDGFEVQEKKLLLGNNDDPKLDGDPEPKRIIVEIIVTEEIRIKAKDAEQTNLIIYSQILGENEAATFLEKYKAKHNKTITWQSGFTKFPDLKEGTIKRFAIDPDTIAEILGSGKGDVNSLVDDALAGLKTERARSYLREKTLHTDGRNKNMPMKKRLLYISMAKMMDDFTEEEWQKYQEYKGKKTRVIETSDFSKVFAKFQEYYDKHIRPKKRKDWKKGIYRPGDLQNPFKSSLFHTRDSEQLIYTYYEDAKKGHKIGIGAQGTYVTVLKLALNEIMRHHPGYKPLDLGPIYNAATYQAVVLFQQTAKIGIDGVVGHETLKQLDKVLFAQRNTQKFINKEGLIGKVSGAPLYADASSDADVIGTIAFSGRVLVHGEAYPGWYKVTFAGDRNASGGYLTESKQGFLKASHVELGIGPDKQVRLHVVTESNLEAIINHYYKPDSRKDRSFCANALLFYNQQYGRGGVYVTDAKGTKMPFNKKAKTVNYPYNQVHVQAGARIWIPSIAYLGYLYDSGEVLSAILGARVRRSFDKVNEKIGEFLNMILPIGGGIYVEGELGVTAFSIGADLEGGFYIYRKDERNLIIERRSILKAGLDVGAGAGAFFGTRARKKGGRHGFGAEAGANASIKAKSILFQTYSFDIYKDMISAMLVMLNYDSKLDPKYLMILLFSHMAKLGLNTDNFLVKSKVGVGLEARAAASAGIGARTGKENMNPQKYGKNNYANDNQGTKYRGFSPERLLGMLNFQLGLNVGAEGMAGMEVEYTDDKGNPVINKDADFLQLNLYQELKLEAGIGIPWLVYLIKPSALPLMLLPKVVGAGLKQKFRLNLKTQKMEHLNNALYIQTGELDYYIGNASEIEIDINKKDGYRDLVNAFTATATNIATMGDAEKEKLFKDELTKLSKIIQQIQIKKRVAFPFANFGKIHKEQMKYQTTKRLLKQTPTRTLGSKGTAFVTFNFQLSSADVLSLGGEINDVLSSIAEEAEKHKIGIAGYLWQSLMQFMFTGASQGQVSEPVQKVINSLFSDKVITSAELLIQAGISFGGGAKAGAAVKFRAQGYGSAGGIYTADVTEHVKQIMTSDSKENKLALLKNIFSANSGDFQQTTKNAKTKDHENNK